MTDADLDKIEQELGIALPSVYRQFLVPFPIRSLAGNTDYDLWDHPERLIELNRELRAGRRNKPWPVHLFAVGQTNNESCVAIDLRSADAPAWWVDFGNLEGSGSGQTHSRFEDWAKDYLGDVRSGMIGDGQNPDGSPAELDEVLDRQARQERRALLLFALLFVPVAIVVMLLWAWLRRKL